MQERSQVGADAIAQRRLRYAVCKHSISSRRITAKDRGSESDLRLQSTDSTESALSHRAIIVAPNRLAWYRGARAAQADATVGALVRELLQGQQRRQLKDFTRSSSAKLDLRASRHPYCVYLVGVEFGGAVARLYAQRAA